MADNKQDTGAAYPQTPDNELTQLQKGLQEAEGEITKQNRKKEALKTDITALQGVVTEITNLVKTYTQTVKNLKCDKEDVDDYVAKNEARITDVVKDKKEKIDSSIKKVEDDVQGARNQVKDLQEKYQAANNAYEKASKEVKAQAAYDSMKSYQKNLQDYLSRLKALRDAIEKGNDKSDVVKYFWMSEMKKIKDLPGAIVQPPESLQATLYQKWDDLKNEKDQMREQKEARDNAKELLEAAQKNLDTLEKDRSETIVATISKL